MKRDENSYIQRIIQIFIGTVIFIAIVAYSVFCHTSWDWGSFFGGAIGGIGTLIAVCITTYQTRNIQQENEKRIDNEKKQKTYQNLLIIYYDLRFALLGIFDFADEFFSSSTCAPNIDKNLLANIYLDKEWIHTVANVSEKLSSEQIGQVYNSYGKILDLLDYVNNKNDYNKNDIEVIKDYVETFYIKTSNTITLQKEIEDLITHLENLLTRDYNKNLDGNLIDVLKNRK